MTDYRITFYNHLASSEGKMFKVSQRAIDVQSALSEDEAIAAAQHAFCRQEGVQCWRHTRTASRSSDGTVMGTHPARRGEPADGRYVAIRLAIVSRKAFDGRRVDLGTQRGEAIGAEGGRAASLRFRASAAAYASPR